MMMPQGYDPQSFQQPSMYGQYYPSAGTAFNPASPGRPKPPGQGQPQQIDEQGQYYQSPGGTRPERTPSREGDAADERKPPARAGMKRPLDDTMAASSEGYPPRPSASSHHLENSNPPPHAAARSAQEGGYHPAGYGAQQPAAGNAPGASAKPASGGGDAPAGRAPGTGPKQEEGGEGINEQQLLQDFFQHF